ncbi:MAG: DUF5828 family protein [Thermoplasmatota archaeon]
MKQNPEITNAGVRYIGEWGEICDFADYLNELIKRYVDNSKDVENYEKWKPHEKEGEKELSDRTAENASLKETKIEKKFNGTKEELNEARENIVGSVKEVTNGKDPRCKIKKASKKIGRTMGAKSVESIRSLEKQIYKKIMLQVNPFYFDTENFSVNVEKNNGSDLYTLTLNIPDEKIRDRIQEKIKKDHC